MITKSDIFTKSLSETEMEVLRMSLITRRMWLKDLLSGPLRENDERYVKDQVSRLEEFENKYL
jgi:hypothetical protein